MTQPAGPNEKPTIEMLKVSVDAESMTKMLQRSIDIGMQNASAINGLTGSLNTLNLVVGTVVQDLGAVKEWKAGVENRLSGSLSPGKTVTTEELAAEQTAREALALQLKAVDEKAVTALAKADGIDAKQDVQIAFLKHIADTVSKNPTVRRIGYAAGAIILVLLTQVAAKYGIHL